MATRVSHLTHAAVEKLLNDGYATIPFSHARIPGVIEGWKNLLAKPQATKDELTIDADGAGDPDDGYIRRAGALRDDGVYDDHKEFFHYRHRLVPRLMRKGVSIDPYRAWLNHSLQELHLQCASTCHMIASALDHRLEEYRFTERVSAVHARAMSVLRLLSYDPASMRGKDLIAKGHTDKSFLTLAIAEERPGLRIAREAHPYHSRANTALIFFGDKAERLTNGRCKALWHDVVDTSGNTARASSRWSIVYFCNIEL